MAVFLLEGWRWLADPFDVAECEKCRFRATARMIALEAAEAYLAVPSVDPEHHAAPCGCLGEVGISSPAADMAPLSSCWRSAT